MRRTSLTPIAAPFGRRAMLTAAAFAGLAGRDAAAQDAAIRWLHLEVNQAILKIWNDVASEFQTGSGAKVALQFLENEAFKAKLPTLLQSREAPSMFYSWGGGVMRAQINTGALRAIGDEMPPDWHARVNPAALGAFRHQGKVWGAPHQVALMNIYCNKPLLRRAGVDETQIKSWDDLLAAVKALRAAGITPIAVGGGDKWPIMHWFAYLVVRAGGRAALEDAKAGKAGGFKGAAFVEAGRLLKQLSDMRPFQDGYLAATFPQMLGAFGDGRAAMILSFSGTYARQARAAADGKGIAHGDLGLISFPMVNGGKGAATDTMGGINAWLVTRNAPPQTAAFLNLLTSVKFQSATAATGIYMPSVPAANPAITDSLLKAAADELSRSTYHQNYFDQDLGPDVGRALNDKTTELASGRLSPEGLAKEIQDAWDLSS